MSWSTINATVDDLAVLAGVAWMIARQFTWRPLAGAVWIPVLLVAAGTAVIAIELILGRLVVHPVDGAMAAAELLLVALTGTAMGCRYRFRDSPESHRRQLRLDRSGLLLWAVFLAVRLGSVLLARAVGAHLVETTGAILISFGTNRLVAMLVAQHRDRRDGTVGPARREAARSGP